MSTILIGKEQAITRQEGDRADVVIWVPAILSMSDHTAKFQVRDSGRRVIITKGNDDIVVDGQKLTIPLLPGDTARRAGKHRWELELTGEGGPVTIGRGVFTIINTDIT